ncbi:MAG: dihydroorotate dehydrogenase electron transfer subunit [Dysgonamonadaceae bacterium]|jgi:dihydroorotate dehydrogenase electron transfer subunit|nr:dihydroorotate dehydrogenase electron transfer subunit [Dysgonamonadaceae bacterium]
MKRYISDWNVLQTTRKRDVCLLRLGLGEEEGKAFPDVLPGQFVQVRVDNSPSTYLRRPISIHYTIQEEREIWLLVRIAGEGTKTIAETKAGGKLNLIYPLGNGFSMPENNVEQQKLLLVGGGVGAAPLLFLGKRLKESGYVPDFLLGGYSMENFFDNSQFEAIGRLFLTTEDGSGGTKGFVTDHPVLYEEKYDFIYACGPLPMMKSVARYAFARHIRCEVSLENTMACGIGACLCCVEKTGRGNVRTCIEGPVFNIVDLESWQN